MNLHNVELLQQSDFIPASAAASGNQQQALSTAFSIPASFWSLLYQEASGFLWTDYPSAAANNPPESYQTAFRFLVKQTLPAYATADHSPINYDWHKLAFFTHWRASQTSLILCFDLPETVKDSIRRSLLYPKATAANLCLTTPFAIHAVILEHVLALHDVALWSARDLVRKREQSRPTMHTAAPDYTGLHELARHAIHTTEMLAMSIEVVSSFALENEALRGENLVVSAGAEAGRKRTGQALRHYGTLLKSLHLRSQALEARLRNEISLALHVRAQRDSLVAARIAEAARVDSTTMKTISILGLVFLPGTFVSTIFSMSFFNFSPNPNSEQQQWAVSKDFWIYWAVAVPVTVATIGIWLAYQRSIHPQRSPHRPAQLGKYQQGLP
ncbi:hypothetical protein LTR08_005315 [Meristemomyces frigidus]|nr:hypothetical protein LTR08_005315 [Meristemomyces frigidus]